MPRKKKKKGQSVYYISREGIAYPLKKRRKQKGVGKGRYRKHRLHVVGVDEKHGVVKYMKSDGSIGRAILLPRGHWIEADTWYEYTRKGRRKKKKRKK